MYTSATMLSCSRWLLQSPQLVPTSRMQLSAHCILPVAFIVVRNAMNLYGRPGTGVCYWRPTDSGSELPTHFSVPTLSFWLLEPLDSVQSTHLILSLRRHILSLSPRSPRRFSLSPSSRKRVAQSNHSRHTSRTTSPGVELHRRDDLHDVWHVPLPPRHSSHATSDPTRHLHSTRRPDYTRHSTTGSPASLHVLQRSTARSTSRSAIHTRDTISPLSCRTLASHSWRRATKAASMARWYITSGLTTVVVYNSCFVSGEGRALWAWALRWCRLQLFASIFAVSQSAWRDWLAHQRHWRSYPQSRWWRWDSGGQLWSGALVVLVEAFLLLF